MSRPRSDDAVCRTPLDHPRRRLLREPPGGFTLRSETGETIRALPDGSGWKIEGPALLNGWRLSRARNGTRLVLNDADGRTELGRTASLDDRGGPGSGGTYLSTGDGRMYLVVLRGPRDGRFDLVGWETPGAYLTARPDAGGWTIEANPAGSGLSEIRPLLILLAAEVLESEYGGPRPHPRRA